MARVPFLAIIPPIIFAGLAGLFVGGMYRDNPDALPSTLEGQPAPALELTPLEGFLPFTEAQLTGPGVKLLNYWASWCAPCRAEHAQLMALKAEGLDIYGVNYKDDPEKARDFIAELGNPYVGVGADADGRTAIDWGVYGVPETFVIDGDGIVVLRFAGPVTKTVLEKFVRPALEAAGAE